MSNDIKIIKLEEALLKLDQGIREALDVRELLVQEKERLENEKKV